MTAVLVKSRSSWFLLAMSGKSKWCNIQILMTNFSEKLSYKKKTGKNKMHYNVKHTINSLTIWLQSSLEKLAAVATGFSFLRARLLGSSFSK